jgi:hypothetical protein
VKVKDLVSSAPAGEQLATRDSEPPHDIIFVVPHDVSPLLTYKQLPACNSRHEIAVTYRVFAVAPTPWEEHHRV